MALLFFVVYLQRLWQLKQYIFSFLKKTPELNRHTPKITEDRKASFCQSYLIPL